MLATQAGATFAVAREQKVAAAEAVGVGWPKAIGLDWAAPLSVQRAES